MPFPAALRMTWLRRVFDRGVPDPVRAFEPTPDETLALVEGVSRRHFPLHDFGRIAALFARVQDLFEGRYPGYRGCDLRFHDFAHTGQVTVAVARLVDGGLLRHRRHRGLGIRFRDFYLVLAAALLHDSGYIKETGDRRGTGAKFTSVHVVRGTVFARHLFREFFSWEADIDTVCRLILWTEMNADPEALECRSETERRLGGMLVTADFLGQMASPSYPDRLAFLHEEFLEAAAESPGGAASCPYPTLGDLLLRTRGFHDNHAMRLMEGACGGVCHDLAWHFPDRQNHYFIQIKGNLLRIDGMVVAALAKKHGLGECSLTAS